jgi:hypothetical protein
MRRMLGSPGETSRPRRWTYSYDWCAMCRRVSSICASMLHDRKIRVVGQTRMPEQSHSRPLDWSYTAGNGLVECSTSTTARPLEFGSFEYWHHTWSISRVPCSCGLSVLMLTRRAVPAGDGIRRLVGPPCQRSMLCGVSGLDSRFDSRSRRHPGRLLCSNCPLWSKPRIRHRCSP